MSSELVDKGSCSSRNSVEVSVVIPAHNAEPFIGVCLHSILLNAVTCTLEVSIYDDGSTDGTAKLLEEFAGIFHVQGVRLVTSGGDEARGVGFAKNRAVQQSCGRFLCFLDADDTMMPDRIQTQYDQAARIESEGKFAFVGSGFVRDPPNSTDRYTRWACNLSSDELTKQVYTAFGPTLIAPTWFMSRALYDSVGGFNESHRKGYPEDLDFFYKALNHKAALHRVDRPLVVYRYHPGCATFGVNEKTIWDIRIAQLERNVLADWNHITIWNAGKQGRRFYKSLSPENQAKVVAMCDVDSRKIAQKVYEYYDDRTRRVVARIPIISHRDAVPPTVICVKLDMTGGQLEDYVKEKNWHELVDYVHFS